MWPTKGVSALLLLLCGCASMNVESFQGTEPRLVLEDYFLGKTHASGILFGRGGEVKRRFTVEMVGTKEGDVLTLEEDFLF